MAARLGSSSTGGQALAAQLVAAEAHDVVGRHGVVGEAPEQLEHTGKVVAEGIALELPGGEPRGVADGPADELAAAAQHVHGLRTGAT